MSDLSLATSGTVPRADVCPRCRRPMCFRVDADDNRKILSAMCGNSQCDLFLVEEELP